MISADKPFDMEQKINNIEILKNEYAHYYNGLRADELQPYKIILGSTLVFNKNDIIDKVILLYESRLIILKNINGSVTKHIIEYTDINYIINEGIPNPSCIIIEYGSDGKEEIHYDSKALSIANSLLSDLRNFTVAKVEVENVKNNENISGETFSNLKEIKYMGYSFAEKALLDKGVIICSLNQRRVYDRAWWVFRKTVTQNHFTIICNNEIVIFLEKCNPKRQWSISGDLIFIPLKTLKCTSIEATGKGMIMRYLFNSGKKYELFYENQRTDELLKIMSFLNGSIASNN
jgi:hypothetical protein